VIRKDADQIVELVEPAWISRNLCSASTINRPLANILTRYLDIILNIEDIIRSNHSGRHCTPHRLPILVRACSKPEVICWMC